MTIAKTRPNGATTMLNKGTNRTRSRSRIKQGKLLAWVRAALPRSTRQMGGQALGFGALRLHDSALDAPRSERKRCRRPQTASAPFGRPGQTRHASDGSCHRPAKEPAPLARSSGHRRATGAHLARRANRCVADPSRASAISAERSSPNKKPGRVLPSNESKSTRLARAFRLPIGAFRGLGQRFPGGSRRCAWSGVSSGQRSCSP